MADYSFRMMMRALDVDVSKINVVDQVPADAAVSLADGNVVIKVIDNGVGIPAEILDQIFEPFFTTKEVGRGTGLGLSTCHSIVTSIGGSISVSAESKGTCFSIMLPLAQ